MIAKAPAFDVKIPASAPGVAFFRVVFHGEQPGVADALAHGVKVTGCTVFEVDAGVDTGRIIDQVAVRVADGDTVESLHERIKVEERRLLLDTVNALAAASQ